ncbi:MAG: metal ABC transporter ATP-binding protein [Lachnospiraceae bacterium]|nr:metal ABC transporter ATP-binding protein [Lachnospiraceae bacterium]
MKTNPYKKKDKELEEIIDDERAAMYKSGKVRRGSKNAACGFHRIEIKNLTVKAGNSRILDDVNLSIYCGKLTVIIGKNGAGKSTLIKSILKERPYEGEISFRDIKNNTVSRLKVGYVPQRIDIDQNAPVSVYDLVASYISKVPVFLWKSKSLYQRIQARLELFDAAELIDKRVCDLSGGELQRVLLAVACTPVPNLLLLDEPVSGIDENGRELFYKILTELKKSYDLSIILVSHDLELTARYADNIVLLDKSVRASGSAKEVMESDVFKETFMNLK